MAFRPVHTEEESAGTLRLRAVHAAVVEPARAGADDRVSELPPDATGYLSGFLSARGRKPAGGAKK
jgi:hypothetical protein